MSKLRTPESLFVAAGVDDSEVGRAFRRAMGGRAYGHDALNSAWVWFREGWRGDVQCQECEAETEPERCDECSRALDSDLDRLRSESTRSAERWVARAARWKRLARKLYLERNYRVGAGRRWQGRTDLILKRAQASEARAERAEGRAAELAETAEAFIAFVADPAEPHESAWRGWAQNFRDALTSPQSRGAAEAIRHLGECGCGEALEMVNAGDWTVVEGGDGEHVWRGVGGPGDKDASEHDELMVYAQHFPVGTRLVTESPWCPLCGEEQDADPPTSAPRDPLCECGHDRLTHHTTTDACWECSCQRYEPGEQPTPSQEQPSPEQAPLCEACAGTKEVWNGCHFVVCPRCGGTGKHGRQPKETR